MSHPTDELPASVALDGALQACTPQDFDGHTCFGALTPQERLEWLDEMRVLAQALHGRTIRDDRDSCLSSSLPRSP